jgi:hypothetical protein
MTKDMMATINTNGINTWMVMIINTEDVFFIGMYLGEFCP